MYTAKEISEFQKKDRRISWLSIFSSLCTLYQGRPVEVPSDELAKIAYLLNDELNTFYPMEEPQPFPSSNPARGQWKDPVVKPCPVCSLPMLPNTEGKIKNPKAPDFKCQDSKCKFQWDESIHTYIPSQFITGVWNKK